MSDTSPSLAVRAKTALEQVCSGAQLSDAQEWYSPHFVDHVNRIDHHGQTGIRRSGSSYTRILSDIRIVVVDQLTDATRIHSRFIVSGRCYGRKVSFAGVTISRFEGRKIIEDWSSTDTFGMLKRLGLCRGILLVMKQ